ncbi:hypothetical protein [Thalassotalea euphylliae]|nr:hypothetical protein [Thalassotalea euphylliae]
MISICNNDFVSISFVANLLMAKSTKKMDAELTESTRKGVFTSIKSRNFAGVLMAFLTCVMLVPGMTTYLPFSAADQIGVPILLFPFIWTGLCLYSYMAEKAWQPWALMITLSVSHGVLSYLALAG